MTIKHLFPPSKPTLDLNFAAERELDPRITFTRSSIGTYTDANGIVQTAAEDEPRFDHDPITGESLGLLIEQSRTNYIQNSTDFNAGDWGFFTTGTSPGIPVCTPNSGTAPDGTNTATRMVCDTGGGTSSGDACYLRCNRDSPTKAAVSIWIKSNTGSDQTLYLTRNPQPVIATNTWKRIFSLDNDYRFGARGDKSQQNVDILIWGAQVEDGDTSTGFSTSYIPTAGSDEIRSPDVCTIQGSAFSSWYNQSEGTVFVSMANSDGMNKGVNLYGSGNNWIIVLGSSNNRLRYQVVGSGQNADIYSEDNVQDGKPIKYVYAYKPGDYAFCIRGDLKTTNANPQPVINKMKIGEESKWSANKRCNCPIARIAYYPRRLTDEQLEALTS